VRVNVFEVFFNMRAKVPVEGFLKDHHLMGKSPKFFHDPMGSCHLKAELNGFREHENIPGKDPDGFSVSRNRNRKE